MRPGKVPTLRPLVGSIYVKRGQLWARVKIRGKWRDRTLGLADTEENRELAAEALRQREAMIAAAEEAGLPPEGKLTLGDWARTWLKRHEKDRSHRDDKGRWAHLEPLVGDVLIKDFRPRHTRAAIRELREGALAPRSIHHCYSVLQRMLKEAKIDEVITGEPWAILRGDLPPKRDAKKGWREEALYTPAEILALVSDRRIPEDRRVQYALLGLGALRFGEAAALRFKDYEKDKAPLGRLTVARAVSRGLEKGTKAERPRAVPVHPTLAAALASWKLGGWARMMKGKVPGPEDLVLPTRKGNFRPPQRYLRFLHRDLRTLGLRGPRRLHDLRRAWITWARDAGGTGEMVRWIAHGPSTSVLDSYTSTPWAALCRVVEALQLPAAGEASG